MMRYPLHPTTSGKTRLLLATICCVALAACETTPAGSVSAPPVTGPATSERLPSDVTVSQGLPRSPSIGPGERPVSGSSAARYYAALCGRAGAGRGALEAAARVNGFVQNTKTGTYYHSKDDLSVKMTETVCSIVFVSTDSSNAVQSAFDRLGGDLDGTQVRDRGLRRDKQYYSAGLRI